MHITSIFIHDIIVLSVNGGDVMFYYLVALLDNRSYDFTKEIQENISKKYDLYDELPMLHITLEVIEDPDNLTNLIYEIESILRDYSKFPIKINGAICFNPPYKSVNLKVEHEGTIYDLTHKLNSELKKLGFKVRENIGNWDLHISIANIHFSKRDWSDEEFLEACYMLTKESHCIYEEISKIQLWKPINNRSEMIVKDFNLKDN